MPVTNYVWDGQQYLMETDGSHVTQAVWTNEPDEFTNLVSQRRGGATQYSHFDALGSTRQITDAGEAIINEWNYDAWGIVLSDTGVAVFPLQYIGRAGYYTDAEAGYIYIIKRIYSPKTARWTSYDPYYLDSERNLFLYASNNPKNIIDPSGMECVPVDAPNNRVDSTTVEAETKAKITRGWWHEGSTLGVTEITCSAKYSVEIRYWCKCSYCHIRVTDDISPEWFTPAFPIQYYRNTYNFSYVTTSKRTITWSVKVPSSPSGGSPLRARVGNQFWSTTISRRNTGWPNFDWEYLTNEGKLYGRFVREATEMCEKNLPNNPRFILGSNIDCPSEKVARELEV